MPPSEIAQDRPLPVNVDAERLVLGSILLNSEAYISIAGMLDSEDFSLEKHRRIFLRMGEIHERGQRVDRITLADELMRNGQLEAVDGFSYVCSLDEGLPPALNLESYAQIVKEKAILRRIIYTSQGLIDRAMSGVESPDELLGAAEESLLRLGDYGGRQSLVNPRVILENYEGGINSFLDPSKRIKGLSTGFVKFDEMTGGLHGGELIILAARPSMGKTALALNIAQHISTNRNNQQPVAVFSLEMSKESLLTRMLCASARVDQQKFRAGYLGHEERRRLAQSMSELVDAPLFIDDTSAVNLMDVHSKLRRLQAERGLGLVVVDYLQLMSGRGRSENRNQEVSALSRGLKLLAKDLNVPFLVLSQLSRAPETRPGDHVPQLSDLRESGSIEQDADLVAFIYREEVYKPDREDLRGVAQVIIAKQRNGPIGRVKLVFLREFTKFENATSDIDDIPEE
ncbi:MAG: replicative DNA helicase [Bryobacterales bacterium]|nr:replicative DNA helicase [Bryobacterales bacterium]